MGFGTTVGVLWHAVPWRRAAFKGTEVLARCNERGEFVVDGGRVEIRYRPRDGRAYRASARNLHVLSDAAIFPDDHCADAKEPAPRAKSNRSNKESRAGKAPRARKAADPEASAIPAGALVAYTDGACSGNPGPAGVGVVIVDGDERREYSFYLGKATNNIAELAAIELALEKAGDNSRPLRIHTDSQYSIGVLTKGWRAKANTELVANVKRLLAAFDDAGLIYVPGHAGVPLNERADELAVLAVKTRRSAGQLPPE